MKMNIKTGDKVKVITGKDKGKEGEVLRVIPETGRVVVRDVAIVHKAQRPTQVNQQGGIKEMEAPIDVSNVMIVCPSCGLPTRIAVNREGGKKVRLCKKCGKEL